MRLTWGQIKDSVGIPVNMCADNAELLPMVNEACELLQNECNFVGKYIRYRVALTDDCNCQRCLVWPRELETIESAKSCGSLAIKDMWYSFLENAGCAPDNNCGGMLEDYGEVCTFSEIIGTNKKLKFYRTKVEDANASVLVLGYDENGEWIRTEQDGSTQDGEVISLFNGSTLSTNFFSSVVGLQFNAPRNGIIRLYEYNTDDATERAIGVYQHNEILPVYRRSLISGLKKHEPCIDVIGLRRYEPIEHDSDYVYPASIAAIKTMLIGLRKRDLGSWNEYQAALTLAKDQVYKQTRKFNGNGAQRVFRLIHGDTFGAGENLQ